jgi:hypothetical protein
MRSEFDKSLSPKETTDEGSPWNDFRSEIGNNRVMYHVGWHSLLTMYGCPVRTDSEFENRDKKTAVQRGLLKCEEH